MSIINKIDYKIKENLKNFTYALLIFNKNSIYNNIFMFKNLNIS